jgi:hypothetical protein
MTLGYYPSSQRPASVKPAQRCARPLVSPGGRRPRPPGPTAMPFEHAVRYGGGSMLARAEQYCRVSSAECRPSCRFGSCVRSCALHEIALSRTNVVPPAGIEPATPGLGNMPQASSPVVHRVQTCCTVQGSAPSRRWLVLARDGPCCGVLSALRRQRTPFPPLAGGVLDSASGSPRAGYFCRRCTVSETLLPASALGVTRPCLQLHVPACQEGRLPRAGHVRQDGHAHGRHGEVAHVQLGVIGAGQAAY